MVAAHSGAGIHAGSCVGPYRIVERIGEGGMGVVYRAAHTALRRPAAIKVLRPELGGCAPAVDRFRAEACATAAIRDPGVVHVYDYGVTDAGQAFIAMELLDGQTLGARLAERGRLGAVDAMQLARRIAAPLAAAHDGGVVHRDLKPDNVFLVRERRGGAGETVKLLDFGVARLDGDADFTAGTIVGTPAYMSPEQCRGMADCDPRSDLYALGCLLFELVTGAPPYGRGRPAELLAAHLRAPVPDVGAELAPPAVRRLIARLLAKLPEDRPASARDVIADIDRWLAGQGVAAPAPRGVRALAGRLADGLAASLDALSVRVRTRRPAAGLRRATAGAPEAAVDTAARTDASGWPYGSAATGRVVTNAPTQPIEPVRDVPVPGPAAPAALLAGN
ncbi:MAG TPA: serine/threonine-protein kinase [Kofleriaceae bacterium]|nr:serine/threonine-protein kinase [Kofleriaceae bacterium]